MPTPKFNRIAQRFMQKINDPVNIVGGVIQPGQVVTTVPDIENFVNMASLNIFNQVWMSVEGNVLKFMTLLPEMIEVKEIAIQYDSVMLASYARLDSADLSNFKEPLPSYKSSGTVYINIIDKKKFNEIFTAKDPFMTFSATTPGLLEYAGKLFYFPKNAAQTGTFTINLNYLRLPINADGSYITSGQLLDTPYTDDWIEKIATEAERLFKIDAGQSS